ncbi:sensor histidine kinase [Spirillospora sp. NPDC048911]|uniref:sensor histidine kinase n=1 Tax=Spirillospora sp. NPDC048911 TaxID=3364527 RepID=UPI0037178EA7
MLIRLAWLLAVSGASVSLAVVGGTLPLPAWTVPWILAAILAPAWFAARIRRTRDRELGERTWLLEKERETAARLAVEGERTRVARELHDIVSHSVSVMLIQAGAARHAVEEGETADALAAVEKTGRDAMTELRHLLGVLAPDAEGQDALAPQPGLSRLGTLVDRIAFAGLPVDVAIHGEPRPLPNGIDVTAYRVVQEALTNALKHAPGSRAEVMVGYGTRNLRLEILNTASPSGAQPRARDGRGLVGLRERVALYGGDLDARRRFGGGYRVRVRIPLERP